MKMFLIGLFLVSFASARPLTKEEKKSEINSLATLIQSQYGPLELKPKLIKLDFDGLIKKYNALSEKTSNRDYFYLLNQLVAEFQDSHFKSTVNTTAAFLLGFTTDLVDGKVLIDEIDRKVLVEGKFKFERGDEIVSLNGQSALSVARDLGSYLGMGNPDSNLRMGAMFLASRHAQIVPPPAGKATLEIRRGTSSVLDKVALDWTKTGSPGIESEENLDSQATTDYGLISVSDIFERFPKTEKNFRCSGKTRIEIPEKATKILETPFVAYYYPTPQGNVGYLRIPHYMWLNATTKADESDLRFAQYEYAIDELERNTVGLVIDQDHNCGGMVSMVEKMAGLFIDKPYKGLEFQFIASRSEYLDLQEWLSPEKEKTIDGKYFRKVLDLIKSTWEKGDTRLTSKITFQGNQPLKPSPIRYSKPVLILIDELSGSGGDAFPAIMQGHGRAKLFGQRTMGAGGHVVGGIKLPWSRNSIQLTKSLFFHPDGTPIENHGAAPDFSYKITRDDFVYGYREYQKQFTKTLLKMTKP